MQSIVRRVSQEMLVMNKLWLVRDLHVSASASYADHQLYLLASMESHLAGCRTRRP